MAQQLKVFVSHSHDDDAYCREIVGALRGAGADVWYDEHNLGSGQLVDTIERELRARPIVVVILSGAALRSPWVRDECTWAYSLMRRDPSRELLPVTASPIEEDAIWLFLSTFKRIEAPGLKPFPVAEACGRLLHALALTPGGATRAAPTPTPQPAERLDELLSQSRALIAQNKYAEAIPFLERATQLDPRSFDAWANLGYAYFTSGRISDAVTAYDHALVLDGDQAWVWSNVGVAYRKLHKNPKAVAAYDRSLALDDKQAWVWNNKGAALIDMKRYDEALVAFDRALRLDDALAQAWNGKGVVFLALQRHDEAIAAFDEALDRDPSDASAWNNKGVALNELKRYDQAMAAVDRSLALDPSSATHWDTKAEILISVCRYDEALIVLERALTLDPSLADSWHHGALALRAVGQTAEAEEAERKARELGWTG